LNLGDLPTLARIAADGMAKNKLRTGLAMLGIAIGIAAFICTVAIGEGGSQRIREQLQNLGDNFVWVEAGSRNVNGIRTGSGNVTTLTMRDENAIVQSVPLIKMCSPQVDARIQIIYANTNWSTTYRGVTPEFLSVRRWALAEGACFTEHDVVVSANVVLLGRTVVERLFGDEDPIGKTIRLRDQPFRVIGVLRPKGETATGQDQDDQIFIPYSTAQHKIKGVTWLDDIMCSAVSAESIRPSRDQITRLMRQRHHIRPGAPDDFNLRTPEELLQAQEETSRTFTILLAGIASVSLIVGGIGIMNIMLVTVVERTREIGVRRAIGATRRDIRSQFLLETSMLTIMSGAAGIVLGIISSLVFSRVLGWPTIIPPSAIVLSFIFSAILGIFFGFYPARQAALLNPIEALRWE
jgi:putative ABC transport system permease protein